MNGVTVVRGWQAPAPAPAPPAAPADAPVLPAGFVVFEKMTAEQRSAAIDAFQAAVDAFAESRGPNDVGAAQAARRLVAPHAHRLALGPDGPVLMIEFPRLAAHPKTLDSFARERLGPNHYEGMAAWRGCNSLEEFHDVLFCDGEERPTALREAIWLLVSSASPQEELARRRALVAAKKKAAAEASAAAAAAEKASREEAERFARENARRIAAWNELPREVQELHAVADRLPEYRPLLDALAALRTPPWAGHRLPSIGMPESFRSDLADAR